MIKLIVPGYCKYCEDFEPIVTQRPERLLTDCGETIYNHLKKAKNNESI